MRELLLGCGSRTNKDIYIDSKEFYDVVRLDNNKDHNPDVVWDLRNHPLPFKDEEFDEIHAYDVLEHLAYQGDYEFFFKEWEEYYRILKPNGVFCGSAPSLKSRWVFGDPSHKRIICRENFIYLSQEQYVNQVGKTKMSDFRSIYKADFDLIYAEDKGDTFFFILRKKQKC